MRYALFPLAVFCALAGEKKLGAPLTIKAPMTVDALVAAQESLAGKTVQVKGKMVEVCEMMGCWTNLVSETGAMIRIKVNDGEIVFPKDHVGKAAIAEGTLKKLTLSKEQVIARAKHEAEEQGRKFDPASVKGGATIFQIQGTGALLLD
ncbi:MAG: DUF4920 domain-containing protein [Bryobacteraceae bacterium]|nr:DUF4920 domain-containing protein [Bryobacteraceae bacterium]